MRWVTSILNELQKSREPVCFYLGGRRNLSYAKINHSKSLIYFVAQHKNSQVQNAIHFCWFDFCSNLILDGIKSSVEPKAWIRTKPKSEISIHREFEITPSVSKFIFVVQLTIHSKITKLLQSKYRNKLRQLPITKLVKLITFNWNRIQLHFQ